MKTCILLPEKSLLTIESPYLRWLPDQTKYCTKESINRLHRIICKKLGISDVCPEIQWCFEKRFTAIWGQAEWGDDENGKHYWKIKYALNDWLTMGSKKRKHIVTHELCHIAVEKLFGHCAKPIGRDQEPVTDHGKHWQELMKKCGQDPFLIRNYKH